MSNADCPVSIILPVYNNQQRAVQSARIITQFMEQHFETFEVIIVDDGSVPGQVITSKMLPASITLFRHHSNQGKGAAIVTGMMGATGNCLIYTDIDLPYDLTWILAATSVINSNVCHAVAGDREHFESTQQDKPAWHRRYASTLFRKALPTLLLGRSFDSQCGFKAFSSSLAHQLFPQLTINRFAFDLEIFYLLARHDIMTVFLPVHLKTSQESSVKFLRDSLRLVLDALTIPSRHRQACPIPDDIPRGW